MIDSSILHFIIVLITATISSLLTYYLTQKYKWGATMASALPSLIVALLILYLPLKIPEYLQINIPIVFFGASFVGMSSNKIINRHRILVFSAFVFGFIYTFLGKAFAGFGGGLGTSALIAVMVGFAFNLLARRGVMCFRSN